MTENRMEYVLDVCGTDPAQAPRLIVDRPMTMAEFKPTMVKVRDLHHLKELIGVPNSVHEANNCVGSQSMPHPINPGTLPLDGKRRVTSLGAAERARVNDMAKNLLLGHVDQDMLDHPAISAVVDHMLTAGAEIPVLTFADITVQNGQVVTWENCVVNAKTITVYGTGQIQTKGTVKIIADEFHYVPNP